ncbi:MAG: thioredoxin-dependent thiol peroxidase [Beduini sp.]
MLKVNDKIPDITLNFDDGNQKKLSEYKGQKLILFFYPKDSTPGCTKEACSLNFNYQNLIDLGYQIIGISPQNQKSKAKFREKNQLIMPLVCDEDTSVCQAFGVWQKKKLYGREYMGVVRTTFVVDESQTITHVYSKVKVASHGEDLLNDLKQ